MDRQQLLNDAEASLRLALDGRQSMIWTALPGIVQSADFEAMTLVVQPTIQGTVLLEDGSTEYVNLPVLVDVPILFPGGGGFVLTFPISEGDEVLVIFASRCIDSWWQNGGIQPPAEFRMHDLSDGFAFCGPRSQDTVLTDVSSSVPQLRNEDGSLLLEFTGTGFKIMGNLEVSGNIIADGEVTASGVPLSTHTHPVIVPSTPFSGDTGAPT